jgi:hypothetical protein
MQDVVSDHLAEHVFFALLTLDHLQYVFLLHFQHWVIFEFVWKNMCIYKFVDNVLQLLETPSDFEGVVH